MTDFIKLISGLAVYNHGIYDGYVIGRASWQIQGDVRSVESAVTSEKRGYVMITVAGYDSQKTKIGHLTVTLLKQTTAQPVGKTDFDTIIRSEPPVLTLEQNQVDAYLDRVKDTNPIHRGADAVVPGLLLVDFLMDKEMLFPVHQAQEIRFRNPLPVGAPFKRNITHQEICIESPEHDRCYVSAEQLGAHVLREVIRKYSIPMEERNRFPDSSL